MNNFIKNVLLLLAVVLISYFMTNYFGSLYNHFSPLYDSSFFSIPKEGLIKIAGFPFAYIFFTTILFQTFAWGNRNKWTGWFLAPASLFFAVSDLSHIYLPIVLALIAFGLATIIRKVFNKTQ